MKTKKCPDCNGTGKDGHDRCVPPNWYVCDRCNGTGKIGTIKIYAFMYNPMIEESVWATMSLHETRKGAEKAMKLHKSMKKKEWKRHDKWQRKEYGEDYKLLKTGSEFGRWEDWCIKEVEVLE